MVHIKIESGSVTTIKVENVGIDIALWKVA